MNMHKLSFLILGLLLLSCNENNTENKNSDAKDTIAPTELAADTITETLATSKNILEPDRWNDFEGTLGNKEIQLSVYTDAEGNAIGTYCFKDNDTKIKLSGTISGNTLMLEEQLGVEPFGRFEGKFVSNSAEGLAGTWAENTGANAVAFKLALKSICGGDPYKRYADLYGEDEFYEGFMKEVKTAILNGDKEWIGDNLVYPLSTTLGGKKPITIKDKKQLIANFDQIFHPAYKEKLKSLCVCNMFVNYRGIMLGNGEIWINNSSSEDYEPVIVAINN
jgi:hypothetical protein